MVTAPQLDFLLSWSLNMKRITTLILTSLALLTMTSSAMAKEVMSYDPLTPTFEFELKTGDSSKMALAKQLEYKTSKGQIAYKDIDCTLHKGFYSKTIDCSGLPIIEIYANDLQISNGYGKFKVRVGDITQFSLPAGSNAIRLMARKLHSGGTQYVRNLTVVDGMLVCEATANDLTICTDACLGYGVPVVIAEQQARSLYTNVGAFSDVSVLECK